jgi:ubiquitin-protein ligase
MSITKEALFKKRVANEIKLIHKDPLEDIDIYVDENNITLIYFLIRGTDDSEYKNGWYIGKLQLSENFPVTPVDFYMLTPNGRFDIEKKICLTISSYHSNSWSPSWTILKILGAFLSVMLSDYDTGISHIKLSEDDRKKLASESLNYNINKYPTILKQFTRFVKFNDNTFSMKTKEEILLEMPKKKTKKDKTNDTEIDISMLKITDK